MGKMNLGFEHLAAVMPAPAIAEDKVLSYEYLDTVFQFNVASEDLMIVSDNLDQVFTAFENLCAIHDVLSAHGSSPALEALIGENFENGLSVEGVGEQIKAAGKAVADFCIKVWQAIKEFFGYWFKSMAGIEARVKKWLDAAKEKGVKFEGRTFSGLQVGGMGDVVEYLELAKLEGKNVDEDLNFDKVLEMKEQTFGENIDAAIAYAQTIYNALHKSAGIKEANAKAFDAQIEAAKKAAAESESKDNKEEIAKIKKEADIAKKILTPAAKAIGKSAAAFLAHNIIGKAGKDEGDAKGDVPAEPKADDQKKAEGEEQK